FLAPGSSLSDPAPQWEHVELTRELANLTGTLAPTIAAPVYGAPEKFTFTLTPEFPGIDPLPSGNVVFHVTPPSGPAVDYTVAINAATGVATWDPTVAAPGGLGTPLQLGTYTVTASYNGVVGTETIYNNPVNGGPIGVTVNAAESKTTVTSSSTNNTSSYG